jgi:uncharacterized membrane protein
MTSVVRGALWTLPVIFALSAPACSDEKRAAPITEHDASVTQHEAQWDCADTRPVPTFQDLQQGILKVCTHCHSVRNGPAKVPSLNGADAGDAGGLRDGAALGDAATPQDASDPRHGAPPGVNFDTYDDFVQFGDTAAFLVKQHAMPYPDGTGVTEEQRQELYAWVACGKPE